ncbi:MAG TPA: baseplate J/gp47 family protein [Polyangiaceae bacterium]|jgi:uncharacterized phage protein gp47/JayE
MPLDVLPDQLDVFTRDEWIEKYKRSYRLRDPGADMRDGTQPANDAAAISDQLQILSQNARQIAQSIPLSTQTLAQLEQTAEELGVPAQFPAVGSSGYVTIDAPTGTTIYSGDELRDEAGSGLTFQCIITDNYSSAKPVPVVAIDVGPATNLEAETQLQWSAPRPGCSSLCKVLRQPDGSGLSGGREEESRDEFASRISDALANPAVAGNDAAYQRAVESSKTHGVSVEKCFTTPCCLGPGTIGVCFTLKPAQLGADRIPNPVLSATVRDSVVGAFPADDGYCEVQLIAQNTDIVLDVDWADGAKGWVDAVTWPPRYAPLGTPGAISAFSATPTSFTLVCLNGNYTGVVQPAVGQTIAFLNRSTGKFARKKIASFTGTGPWVVTVDITNSASDTSYAPIDSQRCCPWSDSLDLLVAPIKKYFDTLGPGEQQATFSDPGLRQRRNPASPKYWPNVIGNRLAGDILKESFIQDAVIREGLGTSTFTGVPGALAYLIQLQFITAFPLT